MSVVGEMSRRRTAANSRRELSTWGIASLVLLLGGRGFGEYNLYVYDRTGRTVDLVRRR
jgi:hypothetical protein